MPPKKKAAAKTPASPPRPSRPRELDGLADIAMDVYDLKTAVESIAEGLPAITRQLSKIPEAIDALVEKQNVIGEELAEIRRTLASIRDQLEDDEESSADE